MDTAIFVGRRLLLLLFTLLCNIAGHMLRKTFREAY